MESIQ